jgi:hypothetical protein
MCECIDLFPAEPFLAENPTREVIQICLLKDEAIVIRKTSRTMQARETLLAFLYEVNPPVVYVEDTVEEVVEANFDTFDEKTTRLLIESALKERDANLKKGGKEDELLGSWGVIIDLVKATTMRRCVNQAPPFGLLYCYTVPFLFHCNRRDRAGDMLQLVVNTGVKSGPKELQSLIALVVVPQRDGQPVRERGQYLHNTGKRQPHSKSVAYYTRVHGSETTEDPDAFSAVYMMIRELILAVQ